MRNNINIILSILMGKIRMVLVTTSFLFLSLIAGYLVVNISLFWLFLLVPSCILLLDFTWRMYKAVKSDYVGELKKEEYLPDGEYKYYHSNMDVVKEIVQLKNGKRIGEGLVYYKTGNIKSKINYKNGYQDGFTFSYDSNGSLVRLSNFSTGIYIGESIEYYEDNAKRIIHDHKSNRYSFFNRSGTLVCEIFITSNIVTIDEYRDQGTSNLWYKWMWNIDGRAKFKPFGIRKNYSSDGQVLFELEFTNDLENKNDFVTRTYYGSNNAAGSESQVLIKELKIETFDGNFSYERLVLKKAKYKTIHLNPGGWQFEEFDINEIRSLEDILVFT